MVIVACVVVNRNSTRVLSISPDRTNCWTTFILSLLSREERTVILFLLFKFLPGIFLRRASVMENKLNGRCIKKEKKRKKSRLCSRMCHSLANENPQRMRFRFIGRNTTFAGGSKSRGIEREFNGVETG